MPIRPEERARYPKDWKAISRRIRDREGNACKFCRAPSGALIVRNDPKGPGLGWSSHTHGVVCMGEDCGAVLIVLTVAHLNHTPEDCSEENLAALCQRCHLRYDAKHHASTARATREKRSGQRRLLP
jgi:hypothetical protein